MENDAAVGAELTDFDLAFAEAVLPAEEGGGKTPPVEEDLLPKEDPTPEPPKEEPAPEPEPPKEEPEPEPPAAPKIDYESAALAKAKAGEDVRLAKEAADKAVADAAARERLTPEEQEIINRTTEDFPDVAKSLQIFERIAMAKAANFVEAKLKEMEGKFSQQLMPALQVAQSYAKNSHEAAILGKHADAFDLLPEVEKWANGKPSILKSAYNAVLDNGSAQDIIELYDVFKSERAGSAQPAQPSEADNAAAKAKAEADAEKERKLKAQEGVRSRQTSQRSSIDENDFEGAFQAAANK